MKNVVSGLSSPFPRAVAEMGSCVRVRGWVKLLVDYKWKTYHFESCAAGDGIDVFEHIGPSSEHVRRKRGEKRDMLWEKFPFVVNWNAWNRNESIRKSLYK
jgi:hypothetical protein